MEGLTLLRQAHEAGLAVTIDGGSLVIRGPKRAEPLARLLIENKPLVLAALAPANAACAVSKVDGCGPSDAACLRRRFRVRVLTRELRGDRPRGEAERLAFGDLVVEWHREHGERVPAWQCAGCGEPIGDLGSLDFHDGNRVHFDEQRSCLTRYGQRWRGAAAQALAAMGLQAPPEGDAP
jgi:hypothetical protein